MTMEAVRAALRRKFKSQLSMAAWRGYANLLLDKTKYVGTRAPGRNMAQIRRHMMDLADAGEMTGLYMAHETDVPMMDAFSFGWGDRCSRLSLHFCKSRMSDEFSMRCLFIICNHLIWVLI